MNANWNSTKLNEEQGPGFLSLVIFSFKRPPYKCNVLVLYSARKRSYISIETKIRYSRQIISSKIAYKFNEYDLFISIEQLFKLITLK